MASARAAFEAGSWAKLAPAKRKAVLIRFADLLEANREELALLETLDMGKPIGDSLTVDIPGAARALRWSGEAIDKIYDEVAATPHDQLGLVTREPVGVVAAIVPWNFPLMMACWKLGPALATGNSVVLKPSEKSPLTAIRIARWRSTPAFRPACSMSCRLRHTVGKALALHMDVDTLVFTGSTRVAKQLMIYAGESNMKRVWLEAGGKSPNIVFADAPDLQAAAQAAAGAIAFNQGEVCTAGSRLLVERSIKERFLPMVVEALKGWKPGNPLDPRPTSAPWWTPSSSTPCSATSTPGARPARRCCERRWRNASGPVLSVISFDSAEEAVAIANDTPYGLAAAVWTADLSRRTAPHALRAGSVGQPVRRRRHDRAVRRLQAVRQRS